MEPTPKITRFCVLPDERRIILGRDLAGLFEEGCVYEATEMLGEIIIKNLGLHALPKDKQNNKLEFETMAYACSDINTIVHSSYHLLTIEEAAIINK